MDDDRDRVSPDYLTRHPQLQGLRARLDCDARHVSLPFHDRPLAASALGLGVDHETGVAVGLLRVAHELGEGRGADVLEDGEGVSLGPGRAASDEGDAGRGEYPVGPPARVSTLSQNSPHECEARGG